MACGSAPLLNSRITMSSRTWESPTRMTPCSSTRRGMGSAWMVNAMIGVSLSRFFRSLAQEVINSSKVQSSGRRLYAASLSSPCAKLQVSDYQLVGNGVKVTSPRQIGAQLLVFSKDLSTRQDFSHNNRWANKRVLLERPLCELAAPTMF